MGTLRLPLRSRGSAWETDGRANSSHHARHEQAIGHSLLKVLQYAGLSSRHRDRQRLAIGRLELDDVGTAFFGPQIMIRLVTAVSLCFVSSRFTADALAFFILS